MRKEILFRMFLQVIVLLVAILSFFPCVFEFSSASVDSIDSYSKTGIVFGNAKWVILVLSIVELLLLCFDNEITNVFFEIISFVTFIVTLLWPWYLIVTSPNLMGSYCVYKWTVLGYAVLLFSLLPFIGFILFEYAKKRNSGSI